MLALQRSVASRLTQWDCHLSPTQCVIRTRRVLLSLVGDDAIRRRREEAVRDSLTRASEGDVLDTLGTLGDTQAYIEAH